MATVEELLFVHKLTRASIYCALEGLSEEYAAWTPSSGAASIQKISLHLGLAERFWLSKFGIDVIEPPQDGSLDAALSYLRKMEDLIQHLYTTTPEAALVKNVVTDRGQISLLWALKRVTHHMSYHLGTLVYLRSILEPDWPAKAGRDYWATAVDAYSDLIKLDS